jgi:hypothetical protein
MDTTAGEPMYTKEYVDMIKATDREREIELAQLRAFKNGADQKQRSVIAQLQPDIGKLMSTLKQRYPDYAENFDPVDEWGKTCHQSTSLETAGNLARVMSCASAELELVRSESSAKDEKLASYKDTMQRNEDLESQLEKKRQRVIELEAWATEEQDRMRLMQEELARHGLLKEKLDFSKLQSRELKPSGATAANALESVTCDAAQKGVTNGHIGAVSTANKSLAVTTSAASRRIDDNLASWMRGYASSSGSNRILLQNNSSHKFIGTSGESMSMEAEVAAALSGNA